MNKNYYILDNSVNKSNMRRQNDILEFKISKVHITSAKQLNLIIDEDLMNYIYNFNICSRLYIFTHDLIPLTTLVYLCVPIYTNL